MNIPPFVYSLAFWQALCYVIAALVAAFTPYKLEAGILLALVLAALKMFDIAPQIRAYRAMRAHLRAPLETQLPRQTASQGSTTIKYFSYEHLPPALQDIAKPIVELAMLMEITLPNGAEKSAGMRKLLEAKDCFVRTKVE